MSTKDNLTGDGDSPRSLRVPVELNEAAIVHAHFWTLLQVPVMRLIIVVNALLLSCFCLLVLRSLLGGPRQIVIRLALGFLLFSIFFGAIQVWRRAKSHFRNLSEADRRGTYTIADDGIGWEMGSRSGSVQWNAVKKTHETETAFYILVIPFQPHVIPKASLNEQQRAELSRRLAPRPC